MNDMNETLAEIRRRGETRIRAGKQLRRRITALCVPLVLSVAALLTVPTLGLQTYEAKPAETVIPAETSHSATLPMTQTLLDDTKEAAEVVLKIQNMKVTGENLERCYTDGKTVDSFIQLITGLAAQNSCASYYSEDETRAGVPAKENTRPGGIRLTLTDGEEAWEYILYSGSLYDVQEKASYPISCAQYTAIMELLGLELP